MKKMLLHELNSKLILEDAPIPICESTKVLIKVCYTGINFADTLLIQGKYQEKQTLPFSPGMEMSGIVVKIGENVKGFKINQRVIAFSSSGGLSEYISIEPNRVISIPDEMNLKEAACFVIAYATSYLGLNYRAKLKKGETLLISGAGGGVGNSAVQIGKIMKANVIAVTNGKEKSNLAKKSGADLVIDISKKPLKEFFPDLQKFDVIYDTVGGSFLRESISFVNTEARVLPIGFASGEIPLIPANIFMVKNIDLIGFYWAKYINYKPEILKKSIFELFYFFKKGLLKPSISKIFDLEESNEAINLVKKRKSLGKVLVKIE